MPFPPQVVEDLLVKSARCCCLCRQFKGQKLEVHHIIQEADGGPNTEDNGIPLCFDCHADVPSYNDRHPKGRKYRPDELKRLRDQWFHIATGSESNAQLLEMIRELQKLQQQTLDRLSAPDYSLALATVAATHGIPKDELQQLFTAHAGRIATAKSSSLESAKALLAAGQFAEAEQAATQFAVLSNTLAQEAGSKLVAAKNNQIDAWRIASLAALQDGRNEAALRLLNKAVTLTNQEEDTQRWLEVHRTLVVVLLSSHQHEQALKLCFETTEVRKAHSVADIDCDFADMYNIAMALMGYGDLANAEKMLSGSFNLANDKFRRDDKRLAATLLGLSQIKLEQKSLHSAEDIARKYLGLLRDNDRLDTVDAAAGFYNLGKILRLRRDNDKSLEMYEKSLTMYRSHLPPTHPQIALCLNDTGLLFLQIGRIAKAISYFIEAIQLVQHTETCDQLMMSMYIANLGRAFLVLGQAGDAVDHFSRAIEIRTDILGQEHPKVVELIELRDIAKKQASPDSE